MQLLVSVEASDNTKKKFKINVNITNTVVLLWNNTGLRKSYRK